MTELLAKQMNVDSRTVGWFVFMTAGVVVAQALMTFDPAQITDWRAWGVGIAAQVVRSLATTFVAVVTAPENDDAAS